MHSDSLWQVLYLQCCSIKPSQVSLQSLISSIPNVNKGGAGLFVGFGHGEICQELIDED